MSELGVRYKCFKCQTKFYDLTAPQPICPACGENQNNDQSRMPSPKQKKKIYRLVSKEAMVIPPESESIEELGAADADNEKAYNQAVGDMEELSNENDHGDVDIPEE